MPAAGDGRDRAPNAFQLNATGTRFDVRRAVAGKRRVNSATLCADAQVPRD